MKQRCYILTFLFCLLVTVSNAQSRSGVTPMVLPGVVIGTDTLPNYRLREIPVFPKRVFKNQHEYRKYTRLMYHVKKAYPWSQIAKKELQTMNDSLAHIHGDRARKAYIKDYEKEMIRKYEGGLRKLTVTQGKILIKLVYRELGSTSYDLVKEYRGNFSAAFWQGIARLFGTSLKNDYDPHGKDADIEVIVQMIEAGLL